RLANMDDLDAQLSRAALHQDVAALHWHRRQEDTVGQIFQTIIVAAHAHFPFDLLVIRRQVLVVDRPVIAGALERVALEITLAETPGHGIPQHGLAAESARTLRVETRFAGLHRRNVSAGKLERHSVSIEVCACVYLGSTLDNGNV